MYNIKLDDSLMFAPKEDSLYSLECLHDELIVGYNDGKLKSDMFSFYITSESGMENNIIDFIRTILDFIWKIIKNIFKLIKKAFMTIYRYFATKRLVKHMKTFEDIISYIIKAKGDTTEIDTFNTWLRMNERNFKIIHIGLIFVTCMDDFRTNTAILQDIEEISRKIDNETLTHKQVFETVLKISMDMKEMFTLTNSDMIKGQAKFMYDELGNEKAKYVDLSQESWIKLKEFSNNITPRLESTRAFILRILGFMDDLSTEVEAHIDQMKEEMDELERHITSTMLTPEAKEDLMKRKQNMTQLFNHMNVCLSGFKDIKEDLIDRTKKRPNTDDESKWSFGFLEIMNLSDRAIKIMIDELNRRLSIDERNTEKYINSVKDSVNIVAGKPIIPVDISLKDGNIGIKTGLEPKDDKKPASGNPSAESIMYNLLFTPDMLPKPDRFIEYSESEAIESFGLYGIMSTTQYRKGLNHYSYYMEEVGLSIDNKDDIKSFKNQCVTPINGNKLLTEYKAMSDNDKDHMLTKDKVSKRRYLLMSSIKLIVESLNSLRESLLKTVQDARTNLLSMSVNVEPQDLQYYEVTIPASMVKSIYSHDYNKVITLLAKNASLKLDGGIDTDSIDVDALNNTIRELTFSRRKHFRKLEVTVPLGDILKTLRGKLTAFEVILIKLKIKNLDEKIPTLVDLEEYQKYLLSLVSMLRTDMIGSITAANELVSYIGGVS